MVTMCRSVSDPELADRSLPCDARGRLCPVTPAGEVTMGKIAIGMVLVALTCFGTLRDDPDGTRAGEERTIGGINLCWCPPGKFTMGSPPGDPERRPDETRVEVTLTRGFWAGKYEVTQGHWKRAVGML